MTFSNIAIKNMRKNYRKYGLYIFATAFNIMVFYMFNAIANHPIISAQAMAVNQFEILLKLSSYIIAVFSLTFIWYNVKFFTRQRQNEIGLFSLMGVRKYQISMLFIVENTIIATISIVLGIGLGVLFSKLALMLLLHLIVFNITVPFTIDYQSVITTSITFYILFGLGTIYSISLVFRFKLTELFSASKQREMRPKVKAWKTLLAIACILAGYYLSQNMINTMLFINAIAVLALTITGTYLLFDTLIVFIIHLSKRNTKRYWRGINLVSTSNIAYRIRSHSKTLASIAVLTAVTISASGIAYGFYYNYSRDLASRNPYALSYSTLETNVEVENIHPDILSYVSGYHGIKNVSVDQVPIQTINVNYFNKNAKGFIPTEGIITYRVLSESQYNALSYVDDKNRIDVNDRNIIMFYEWYNPEFMELQKDSKLWLHNEDDISLEKIICQPIGQGFSLRTAMVVDDDYFQDLMGQGLIQIQGNYYGYLFDNPLNHHQFYKDLKHMMPEGLYYVTYYDNFVNISSTKGIILFTGVFLGIIFLVAKGSIIYFKMISEASSDVPTFDILRKIGLQDRDMLKIIAKQLIVIFALPLIIGASHAFFAMRSFSLLLGSNTDIMTPMLIVAFIYCIIYSFFYLLTVRHYKHICMKRIG